MINRSFKKNTYLKAIALIVLLPNIFVVIFGIESFPYTCAPMFGHYIDDDTDLYLFKFEGVTDSTKVNLVDYYGKPEEFFIRHFFSKVYGSTKAISPFDKRLKDSESDFQYRMDTFFNHYSKFILEKYNLSFDKINLEIKQIDQNRNTINDYTPIGYFNYSNKKYQSLYENSNKAN